MKKTIGITVALFLLLATLCACGSREKTIVGSWKCDEVGIETKFTTDDGDTLPLPQFYSPDELGCSASVVFYEDGTYKHTFVANGETSIMSGSYEGTEDVINRIIYTLYDEDGDVFSSSVYYCPDEDSITSLEGFITDGWLNFKRSR